MPKAGQDVRVYVTVLIMVDTYTHKLVLWSSVSSTFRPSGLPQVRRSIVLHKLKDREGLMLFIRWFRDRPLSIG